MRFSLVVYMYKTDSKVAYFLSLLGACYFKIKPNIFQKAVLNIP